MNTTKEKFKDVRVRQAINYALDKQTFVDTIIEGRGTVANSYINSMIPGWTDEVELIRMIRRRRRSFLRKPVIRMDSNARSM